MSINMKKPLRNLVLLSLALCSLSALGACASQTDNFGHSSGTPVNPETDPGGQGVAGSRSTGANTQGTPGRP